MNRRNSLGLIVAGAVTGLVVGTGLGVAGYRAMEQSAAVDDDDLAPAASSAAPAAGSALQLTPEQTAAAGLRVARLETVALAPAASGYARAIDLAPLAAIAADVATAQASAQASSREQARLAALRQADAGASQRELEAATAQASADRARLTLACQRAGLEFGLGLARLGCGQLARLARAAAAGQLAVLRIDLPGQVVGPGAVVDIDLAPGHARVTVLGPASAGDSALQSAGQLALLRGAPVARLGTGRVLVATLRTGPVGTGLLIPREALVRVDGGLFAWRALAPNRFERVPVAGAIAGPAGWTVPAGSTATSIWQGGQSVVVAGAGTLLGLEHAAPPAEDD